MTQEQAHHSRALDSFCRFPAVITFFFVMHHFLTAHLLFGPFVDNVELRTHIFGGLAANVGRRCFLLPARY